MKRKKETHISWSYVIIVSTKTESLISKQEQFKGGFECFLMGN